MVANWLFTALVGWCFFLGSPVALAAAPPVKDREYRVISPAQPPLDSSSAKQVEVIEFFYYGCPHCYNLQPHLKEWLKSAPKDVAFRRMPTVFRESWLPLTHAYYALESIGVLEKIHDDVFDAVQQKNVRLGDRQVLLEWAGHKGVDVKKLSDAYDSFAVQTKTRRSVQFTRTYGISGTPSIVVGGRYLTGPSMTLNTDNSIDYARFSEVLNALVEMARAAPTGGNG